MLDYATERSAYCRHVVTLQGRLIRVHRAWPYDDIIKPVERCSCNKFPLNSSEQLSKIEWLDQPGEGAVKRDMCYINAQVGGWVHVPPPETLSPPWKRKCVCGACDLTNDVPFRIKFISDLDKDDIPITKATPCSSTVTSAAAAEDFFNN